MVTAKEIAKQLNLSEAAVSIALHNKAGVSTKTKKKVLELAQKLGYDFSKIAAKSACLTTKGTLLFVYFKKHGAIVTDTAFFSQLSEGIHHYCSNNGYLTAIQYIYEDTNINEKFTEYAAIYQGIILLATEMNLDDLKKWKDCPLPFVVLDNYQINFSANYITINNIQGAYQATKHLIKSYNKQPGYMHSSYNIQNFTERKNGFFKAVTENGLSKSLSIVHHLTPSVKGAYADMLDILNHNEQIADCYFADNDLIAIGAMKAIQEYGLTIPHNISIIGFDDIPMACCMEPPLTSIRVPIKYLSNLAVKYLIENICLQSKEYLHIEVATQFIQRKSCL